MTTHIKPLLLPIGATFALSACTSTTSINDTAPPASQQRNLIDVELDSYTQALIDANNRLVSARVTKVEAVRSQKEAQFKHNKFSGLDMKRNFDCECDLKTAMQVFAIQLGWDMEKVLEIGRKPAQGVPVTVSQRDKPLALVLESLDTQVGHFVDIRIDPTFESILIEYKTLDAPRSKEYEIN